MTGRIKINFKSIAIAIVVLFFICVMYFFVNFGEDNKKNDIDNFKRIRISLPESPLNASYKIDDEEVKLVNGTADINDVNVSSVGAPVFGDMNGDKINDAIILLDYFKNSSTSKYLAFAVYDESGFLGMNAAKLDSSEKPDSITIEDEFVSVKYTEEDVNTEYFIFTGTSLTKLNLQNDDKIFKGMIESVGEEYIFTDCLNASSSNTYILYDASQSKVAIDTIYKEKAKKDNVANGVYMVLGGKVLYEDGDLNLNVEKIISVPRNAGCEK